MNPGKKSHEICSLPLQISLLASKITLCDKWDY